MTPQEKLRLAGQVLGYGKAVAPDRFPRPSEETLAVWADTLGSIRVPVGVWPEAVRVWATDFVGERMATPRELKEAARVVVSRWESDPVRRRELGAFREARRVQRDRELAEGTFGEVRGYLPPAVSGVVPVGEGVLEAARRAVTPERGIN